MRPVARVASTRQLSLIASRLLTNSETVVWMVVAARGLLLNPALGYRALQLAIGHCVELAGRADLAPRCVWLPHIPDCGNGSAIRQITALPVAGFWAAGRGPAWVEAGMKPSE